MLSVASSTSLMYFTNLYDRNRHHLKHSERFTFTLFLKG